MKKTAYVRGWKLKWGLRFPQTPRILLRHIPPRRFRHHPEFVEPHHRVVAHLELEPRLLLDLSQEVRFLLHEVQRDLGMEAHRELTLLVLGPGALECPLHPPHHHLRPEHAAGP